MHHFSPVQLLVLWSQLEACYYEKNKYGGDMAEIYMSSILPSSIVIEQMRQGKEPGMLASIANEILEGANASLLTVLAHFAKTHDVQILVEGQQPGPWIEGLWHRMHIQVLKQK